MRCREKSNWRREGFIPAPGELVSKVLFELSEYPYLRKYLARKRQFSRSPVTRYASILQLIGFDTRVDIHRLEIFALPAKD